MTKLMTAAITVALIALGTPVSRAAIISIDDSAEGLTLQMFKPLIATNPGDAAPGTGAFVNLNNSSDPANGLSGISYNAATETLSFTYQNVLNWNSNVDLYQLYTEFGGGSSDLFRIQGVAGTTPDIITFISDPGNLIPLTGSTPIGGPLAESGGWQLAFNTGPDQYYVRSDVETPIPAALPFFAAGLGGLGLLGRRRKRKGAAEVTA
jgi:hypothetical protein